MPNMVIETFPDPATASDPNYVMSCRVCGATVTAWRLHKSWHEKLGDAVEQPAPDAAE